MTSSAVNPLIPAVTTPNATLTTLEEGWESTHQKVQWGQYPSEYLIQWIARNVPDDGARQTLRVLDVGCGAGANLWYLAEQGFTCTGMDISATALDRCKTLLSKRGQQAELVQGSITDLPFSANHFDIVIDLGGSACLPLATMPAYLSQLMRVLKPGGHFFACFPGAATTQSLPNNTPTKAMTHQNSTNPESAPLKPTPFFVATVPTTLSNAATVQLFDQATLQTLLSDFSTVQIEENMRSTHRQTQWLQHFWVDAHKAITPHKD
jgi:ubiquinone/menaquinone biosynthesis C-methylase UbiE